MPLISHRGAAHLAIANSAESIMQGDAFQPEFIEVDINCTSDDELVIYHGSVSRFLQGKKTKETYAELKAKFAHLMKFSEFLKLRPNSAYIFDIKIQDQQSLDTIVADLKKFYRQDFAFTSPHETALARLHSEFPNSIIFQSQPYHHGPVVALEIARKHGFDGIALNKWWLTPIVYNICRFHKLKIDAYTIDSALGIWLGQRLFPGAYITTNRPDIYRKLFPKG